MPSVSSRICTRVSVSISYDDNDYTTGTSYVLNTDGTNLGRYLLINRRLLPEEREGFYMGTSDLQYIDQHIFKEIKTRQKKDVAWIGSKKHKVLSRKTG